MEKQSWMKLVLLLMAVFFVSSVYSEPAKLGVDFSWDGIKRCTGISPEIKVSNIPEGTISFKVQLRDLDAPDYNHGQGIVPNDGSGIIARKAVPNGFGVKNRYRGPCPPSGAHNYEFTVSALDKDGNVLAVGSAIHPFS